MPCNRGQQRNCKEKHCVECPDNERRHLREKRPFCADHLCKFKDCAEKKNHSDKYCVNHACRERSCDGIAHRRNGEAYCIAHECSHGECHNKNESPGGFCKDHTPHCQIGPCKRTDLDTGSKCCSIHRCRRNACENPAVNLNGECQFHVTCQESGCASPRAEKTEGGFSMYCLLHIRHRCPQCENWVTDSDTYCVIHACGIRGCEEPNLAGQEFLSQFCATHTCSTLNCNAAVCDLRDRDLKHCQHHKCAIPPCRYKAREAGGYCTDEHACSEEKCREKRSDTVYNYYCKTHECSSRGCALRARQPGALCSDLHACAVLTCTKTRSGVQYCKNHECRVGECAELVRGDGTPFCTRWHACAIAGCGKQRMKAAQYRHCSDHKCKQDGCHGLSKGSTGGGYCEEFGHVCLQEGCNAERHQSKSPNPGDLCSTHLVENMQKQLDEERRTKGTKAEEPLKEISRAEDKQAPPQQPKDKHRIAAAVTKTLRDFIEILTPHPTLPTVAEGSEQATASGGSGSNHEIAVLMFVPRTNSFLNRMFGQHNRAGPDDQGRRTSFGRRSSHIRQTTNPLEDREHIKDGGAKI